AEREPSRDTLYWIRSGAVRMINESVFADGSQRFHLSVRLEAIGFPEVMASFQRADERYLIQGHHIDCGGSRASSRLSQTPQPHGSVQQLEKDRRRDDQMR